MKNNIHLQRIMISILTVALVLGVTVCPVSASQYYYTNTRDFCNAINPQITANTGSMSSFYSWFVYDVPLDMQIAYDEIIDYYGFTEDSILFADLRYTTTGTTNVQVIIYVADYYPSYAYITRSGSSDSIKMNISFPNSAILGVYSVSYNPTTQTFSSYSYTTSTTTSYNFTEGGYRVFYGFYPVHFTCRSTDSNNSYYLNIANNGGGFYNPASGGGGGSSSGNVGNIGDVNWVNFASMLAAYLGANYTFTINGTTYNSSYSNVGWCLAYLFECMENPTLQTITLDNTTMDNPVFRLLYGNAQNPTVFDEIKLNSVAINNYLSQIRTLLNEAVYEEDNNIDMIATQIYYLRNDIQDIYDDLYPEDARIINNTMEEEFYDSENGGTSLTEMQTVFGVGTESRDAFDTGASFSLSGLFSFKNDGNWGFWSTQCQNDMDNVPQVRKAENYDSTAYDDQLEELMSIWGLGNNDK